jgi:GMP synthase-like glutamine amidotransferase
LKPVAIFRFSPGEGAGYFQTFLDARQIPTQLFQLDQGATIPIDLDAFSGFVFMGGPMSVNDDLPWIPPILDLIRRAIGRDQPCIGHCLGGQLIAKAMGGVVTKIQSKKSAGIPFASKTMQLRARGWVTKL